MSDQDSYEVLASQTRFRGRVIEVRVDDVRMSDGSVAERELVAHPGAVAIVALDDNGAIVLVNQYRPAVRARLDELPAGLLDVDGEPALAAAKRELAEEAKLAADQWHVLVDLFSSPGMTDEAVRIFLARGLTAAGGDFAAENEEIDMTVSREPLAEATRRVLTGAITNASAVAGILAAVHGRATGWRELRPADAAWPARPGR
ncbi:NUDIX domain-containing protein [uncultured Jatrophihabitans sp.]|uniref:NUDIX domain-containing protein n=1 Tax=uncultured Jatrophihabitans sp. TaxID=1610747 RepID=UPI0035CBF9A2